MKMLAIEEFETGRDANGRFTEGHIPWLKGTKDLVRPNSGSFRPGLIPWNKGKPYPNVRGNKNPMKRPEVKARLSEARGTGISFRNQMKHLLEQKYIFEKKTGDEIATDLNLSRDVVFYWLNELEIPCRNRSAAKLGRHNCSNTKFKKGQIPWSKGLRGIHFSPGTEFKSDQIKQMWRDPKYRQKVISKTLKKLRERPTKPEQILIEIIRSRKLPLKYVGNGALIVGGLNPDFIADDGRKKIVEVFGRAFHDPTRSFRKDICWHQQYFGRIAYYAQCGYDCLIIWDDELRKGREEAINTKIGEFLED